MKTEQQQMQEYYDKYYPRKPINDGVAVETRYIPDITIEWALSTLTPKFLETLHGVLDPYLLHNFGEEINLHLKLKNDLYVSSMIDNLELPRIVMANYMQLSNIQTKEVIIYKLADNIHNIPKEYHRCNYCHGYTKNDERGNCLACGGPRKW